MLQYVLYSAELFALVHTFAKSRNGGDLNDGASEVFKGDVFSDVAEDITAVDSSIGPEAVEDVFRGGCWENMDIKVFGVFGTCLL